MSSPVLDPVLETRLVGAVVNAENAQDMMTFVLKNLGGKRRSGRGGWGEEVTVKCEIERTNTC